MQAKDLTISSSHSEMEPRVFGGVLAHSNQTTPLASKTPSTINCKLQEVQTPNLENENQALKTQVEMLKQLLLGICKDQKIEHPLLTVMNQSPSKVNMELLQSLQLPAHQKQKSPPKGSPKKYLMQSKENNIDFQNERTLHTQNGTDNSPSPLRRRRSDRVHGTSIQKEHCTAIKKVKTSIQEMPLQIQNKDLQVNEDQQLVSPSVITNQSNIEFNEDSARFENVLDQNQTAELNENEEIHNNSQMHIKYAKMLEELEDQSANYNCDETNEVQVEQITILQEELEKTQPVVYKIQSRTTHLKNKHSSQLEHKNFYELELEQLKTELQQVSQEEEKLLSLLVPDLKVQEVFQESPLKPAVDHSDYSPKIRLLCIPVIENIKETDGEDSFSTLSDRIIERTPVKSRLTKDDLMNNLKDEVEYLLENDHEQDDSDMFRPVKIESPKGEDSQTKFNRQYLESSGGARRNSLSSCKKEMVTPSKQRSPIKKGTSPSKRFSVQRTDIKPVDSPPQSPKKKSLSSNKRQPRNHKSGFEMKRIGDHSSCRDDQSNKSMQELDQMAKERALAQGLQQQEEPSEEETFNSFDCLNNPQIISTSRLMQAEQEKPSFIGNYFGNYSKEKSEEIRNQRQESIKKAEELLSNSIAQQAQNKRPEFITKYLNRDRFEATLTPEKVKVESEEDLEVEQEENDYDNIYGQLEDQVPIIELRRDSQVETNVNDISFQDQEVAAINFVKFSNRDSNMNSETSSKYQTLLNIEIPSKIQPPTNIRAQPVEHEEEDESPVKNHKVTLKYQAYINKKTPIENIKQSQNVKNQNRSPYKHSYNQTQTLGDRRKSTDNQYSQKAKASTAFLMQSLNSNKSRGMDNQSVLSATKSTANHSTKPSPFKKNKMAQLSSKTQAQQEDMQAHQFATNFDAELLYQFRAKSVIKRREELLNKRQNENNKKLQAKNDKIDKLRQSRNSRLSTQRSNKDQQYSALKVQEYNDEVSPISVNEPRFYQSNIEGLSQRNIANSFTPQSTNYDKQRISLPSTHAHISSRLSDTSSLQTASQLVSVCSTFRKDSEEPVISSRKHSAHPTSTTHHLFKKNPKGQNQQIINRTMRLESSKHQPESSIQGAFVSQINSGLNTTTTPSLSTTLHTSKSFIFKDSASKTRQSVVVENQKAKHNFKPMSKGLTSSRSTHKLTGGSQYQSTQRDSLGIPIEAKRMCENCERLRSKGLSTDFCLSHYDTVDE